MRQTSSRGIDVILDMVGAPYFGRNIELLALEGRLLQIAVLHGAKTDINLVRLLRQRITITGSTLRSRTVDEKGAIAKALEQSVWPLVEARKIRPVIYATVPLNEAAEAHRLMESGSHIGKILLTV
jgi:NADPH:quinone reductase